MARDASPSLRDDERIKPILSGIQQLRWQGPVKLLQTFFKVTVNFNTHTPFFVIESRQEKPISVIKDNDFKKNCILPLKQTLVSTTLFSWVHTKKKKKRGVGEKRKTNCSQYGVFLYRVQMTNPENTEGCKAGSYLFFP